VASGMERDGTECKLFSSYWDRCPGCLKATWTWSKEHFNDPLIQFVVRVPISWKLDSLQCKRPVQ